MASRLQLHKILCNIEGVNKVYFSPPENISMVYPCIVYKPSVPDVKYANNHKYINTNCYELMVIDEDPDSEIPHSVSELPLCSIEKFYTYDNLNHTVFTLYY